MNSEAKRIERTYVTLTFMSTLSASLIWGINTLFLLSAGLSNLEAFAANAFFTAGQVIFEVPTGIVADSWGRRLSYLLGAVTLMLSTIFYVILWAQDVSFWMWALSSLVLGLGFTFFTGATEAWLVDALDATHHSGNLESVFGKAQIATGAAMLVGSIAGGVIAQMTNLGVPYILRAGLLFVTFILAYLFMHDLGFKPTPLKHPLKDMRALLKNSIDLGFKNRPVRWLILTSPFLYGSVIYAFYALQPYLLELYGNPNAYSIAGLAAAGIASAQMIGGMSIPYVRRLVRYRSTLIFGAILLCSLTFLCLGLFQNFYLAIVFVAIWAVSFAILTPMAQALLNSLIPSQQRATLLSFNNLLGSSGGVVTQPVLGRAADVFGYAVTYLMCSFITAASLGFVYLVRREKTPTDFIDR